MFSNFIAECPNGYDEQVCADCTFEQGLCQWLDTSSGPFAWKRDQGINAGPTHLGPAVDRKYFSCCYSSNNSFVFLLKIQLKLVKVIIHMSMLIQVQSGMKLFLNFNKFYNQVQQRVN